MLLACCGRNGLEFIYGWEPRSRGFRLVDCRHYRIAYRLVMVIVGDFADQPKIMH